MGKFNTKRSKATWTRRLKVRRKLLEAARRRAHRVQGGRDLVTREEANLIHHREAQVREAERMVALRTEQLQAAAPLRIRALREAEKLIGVMEQGGNNVGAAVEKIIRGGGGVRGQAWCGWFNAYCYRLAGSKAVTWEWGAVRLLGRIAGVRRITTPLPGDIVSFTFDHEGMFVQDNGDGTIQTIEANTGTTGAVSDSNTGGDGVYRKRRPKSLVAGYWRVGR